MTHTHTMPADAFKRACNSVFDQEATGPQMAEALGVSVRSFYLYRSGERLAPIEIGGRLLTLAAAARARLDAVEDRLERLTTGPGMERGAGDGSDDV
jgi:hypothetical protein